MRVKNFIMSCLIGVPVAGMCGAINDTGMIYFWNPGDVMTTSSPSGLSRQDAGVGRDISFGANSSNGYKGFAFRKVCNSGEYSGVGSCPANPVMGGGANDWGCTRDQVTGLMWLLNNSDSDSVLKPGNGLLNQGNSGDPNDAASVVAYANSVNGGAGACGRTGWRLPAVMELHGLVRYSLSTPSDAGAPAAIDLNWFPHVGHLPVYWTNQVYPEGSSDINCLTNCKWAVNFTYGYVEFRHVSEGFAVMLVR